MVRLNQIHQIHQKYRTYISKFSYKKNAILISDGVVFDFYNHDPIKASVINKHS